MNNNQFLLFSNRLLAMFLAAIGVLLSNFGAGIVSQIAPETLTQLAGYGLGAGNIALAGRVFGALIIYGLIGSLVSGLIASVGGMIYPKLNH